MEVPEVSTSFPARWSACQQELARMIGSAVSQQLADRHYFRYMSEDYLSLIISSRAEFDARVDYVEVCLWPLVALLLLLLLTALATENY